MSKPKIAFICVHNSCRSQIAEAFGKVLAADVFESYSAGTETKPQINQDAVRLMKELYGIDMEKTQYSKLISAIPKPDIAISMGCNVSCPFIGRPLMRIGVWMTLPEKAMMNSRQSWSRFVRMSLR